MKVRIEMERDESGVAMLEVAVLAALIAVVCMGGIRQLGYSAGDVYCNVGGQLKDSGKPVPYKPWYLDRSKPRGPKPCIVQTDTSGDPRGGGFGSGGR